MKLDCRLAVASLVLLLAVSTASSASSKPSHDRKVLSLKRTFLKLIVIPWNKVYFVHVYVEITKIWNFLLYGSNYKIEFTKIMNRLGK